MTKNKKCWCENIIHGTGKCDCPCHEQQEPAGDWKKKLWNIVGKSSFIDEMEIELQSFILQLLHQAREEERESFKKGIEVNKEWSMIRTTDLAKLVDKSQLIKEIEEMKVNKPNSEKEEMPYEIKKVWLEEAKKVIIQTLLKT